VLYDTVAQHALQTRLVPESAPDTFLPIYPPQTALLFAPLAGLSYGAAALFWAAVTIGVYALVLRAAWRPARAVLSDARFVAAAAAGFPPFWNLVLHGQTTTVPLLGFGLGSLALAGRRRFLAGLAFGLLAIKPQFGLELAAVMLVCGEWAIVAGLSVSVVAQAGAAVVMLGASVLGTYADTLRHLPEYAPLLEPKPYQLHSIRAVANLLPTSWLGTVVWATLSVAVTIRTIRVWRTGAPVAVRLGLLIVATVLVSPHLTIYDATVLALPLLWLGAWVGTEPRADRPAMYWSTVYWLFVTLLLPTALLIRVQISVLILGWLFLTVSWAVVCVYRPTPDTTG
jgi:hypothetical protein